jgi:hypothetical protein
MTSQIPQVREILQSLLYDVCACVEDDKNFLLECPVYESIRMKYKNVFNEDSMIISVLNCPDQNLFGRVLHEMLLHRSTFI